MIGEIRQFVNYNSSAAKEYQKEIRSRLQICSTKHQQLKEVAEAVQNEFNEWINEKK